VWETQWSTFTKSSFVVKLSSAHLVGSETRETQVVASLFARVRARLVQGRKMAQAPALETCLCFPTECGSVHGRTDSVETPGPEDGVSASPRSTPCHPRIESESARNLLTSLTARRLARCDWYQRFNDRFVQTQEHPPAAGGQPFPLFAQHQLFLATDHPAIQFAKPALQS